MSDLDDLLALDLLTLREHTALAGDVLDPAAHREVLARGLAASEAIRVRRGGALVAYAMLSPGADGCWFVSGFNTHPRHRDAGVLRELFAGISRLAHRHAIAALRSHVYKTNRLSLAFHRRLGFQVTRENAKAVEFTASIDDLRDASRAVRAGSAVGRLPVRPGAGTAGAVSGPPGDTPSDARMPVSPGQTKSPPHGRR